jgi:lipoate synthase
MSNVENLKDTKTRLPKPAWLRVKAPTSPTYVETKKLMRDLKLHTVCEEAACPNIGECWSATSKRVNPATSIRKNRRT